MRLWGVSMSDPESHADTRVASYLLQQHGPLMHGRSLWLALGYVSAQAFRRAIRNGLVPVRTFTLDRRKGRFAKTLDVADWLTRLASPEPQEEVSADSEGEGFMPPG